MENVLITGITGFVGSYMAEMLLKEHKKVKVYGTMRWRSRLENIEKIKKRINLIECDLKDANSVNKMIEEVKPDRIFHLAAQSFVPTSWHAPTDTMTTNVISQINIFEALRNHGNHTKIQIAGSSEEYGMVYKNEVPIKEENPLRPLSPYGVSKVAQDLLAYQYYQSYRTHAVRTRAFNHSVSKWTPVILKDTKSGLIDIKYISELRKYKPQGYMGGKLYEDGAVVWNMSRHDISIWANNKWTKILHLSCHPIRDNKLLTIVSRGGIVEVTDNHSIIGFDDQAVLSGKLKPLDKIKLVDLPNSELTCINEEIAWLYGFFAAEGCCTGGRVRIYNQNKDLLLKCKEILLRHFAQDSYIREDKKQKIFRLSIRKPFDLAKKFKKEFYAADSNKKIPKIILNANKEVKLSFLQGYNKGDGLQKGYGSVSEFKNFKTKSRILASGLCYLINNTTSQRFTLSFEDRNTGYISINLNSNENPTWGKHLVKPSDEIVNIYPKIYQDEVWDFETEEHVFHAGIGGNLVHNTGPRRGDVFVESNFAKQVAEIEKGLQEPIIKVGNLEARRDFTDVRDIVRAYWLSLEKGKAGEVYNICSGKDYTIRQVLNMLLAETKLKIKVEVDPTRLRPSDVEILLGDYSKFNKQTGWKPEIPFEKTLKDILDYWRKVI